MTGNPNFSASSSHQRKTIRVGYAQKWSVAITGFAYWGNVIRTGAQPGASGLALVTGGVLQNGAFCAAAWAMLATIAWRIEPGRRAGMRQLLPLCAACVMCAVPARQAAMLAMLVLGWHFAALGSRLGRTASLLLFGLAAETIWTSPYLLPLHAAIGKIDAELVSALLSASGIAAHRSGNVVWNGPADFSIEILAPCASTFPLAAVTLAYIVTRFYQNQMPSRRDLPWLAISWLASAVLTEGRLLLMTSGNGMYLWLHDGNGVTLYTMVAAGFAVLFPTLAGLSEKPARRVLA